MLCNDCEQLPKCECCGKPIKQDAKPPNIILEQQVKEELPPELPVAVTPIIPSVPLDDEKIPADKPRKKLEIKPAEEMNELVDVYMKGW